MMVTIRRVGNLLPTRSTPALTSNARGQQVAHPTRGLDA
jgi:hypothetical protein